MVVDHPEIVTKAPYQNSYTVTDRDLRSTGLVGSADELMADCIAAYVFIQETNKLNDNELK